MKYVSLRNLKLKPGPKRRLKRRGWYVCNSIEAAIGSLDELGICCNWAMLTQYKKNSTYLVYQGWTSRRAYERFVELPFDPKIQGFSYKFKKLLERIFAPFLIEERGDYSVIEIKKAKKGFAEKGEYCVFLFLYFLGNVHKEISNTLSSVEDDHSDERARFFWLD